jgi:O-antigen/teichoic acid export membrane protein
MASPLQPAVDPSGDHAVLASSVAEVKSGAKKIFLSNWTVLLLRAATTVVVVRAAGAEAKGIQAYVVACAAILSIVLGLGFSTAISFWINSEAISVRVIRRRMLWQSLIVSLVLSAVYPWLTAILPGVESKALSISAINVWTIAMTPLLLLNEQMTTLALALGRVRNYSLQVNGEALTFGVAIALFLIAGKLNVQTVLISTLIGYAVATVVGWIGIKGPAQNETSSAGQGAANMYRFAMKGYPAALINGVQKRLDLLIIGPMLGAAQLAYYAIAAQGYQALMSLPRALTGLLTRSVCKAGETGAQHVAFSITKRAVGWMSVVALLLTIAGVWAIPLVYGSDFRAAVPPFVLLAWASVFTGAAMCLQTLCFGRGKPAAASLNVMITAVLKILLLFLLVAPFGIVGCALATLLAAILGLAFQFKQVRGMAGEPKKQAVE